MSRKVFTAGEVLAAADVNTFLMDQTVMSFAGTAARGSAIGTATEGMYTHLEDTDDLQFWNGSAWQSPLGLTRLVNQNITTSTGYAVDNVFTSQFENYRVILKVDAMSAANSVTVNMRYRKGGVTQTNSTYRYGSFFFGIDGGTSGIFTRNNGGDFVWLGNAGVPSTPSVWQLDIFSPNVATTTTSHVYNSMIHYNGTSPANSSNIVQWAGGNYTTNDNLDGLIIYPGSGNFTGNIKIYGYRN